MVAKHTCMWYLRVGQSKLPLLLREKLLVLVLNMEVGGSDSSML